LCFTHEPPNHRNGYACSRVVEVAVVERFKEAKTIYIGRSNDIILLQYHVFLYNIRTSKDLKNNNLAISKEPNDQYIYNEIDITWASSK
jgi:hypothetical protein